MKKLNTADSGINAAMRRKALPNPSETSISIERPIIIAGTSLNKTDNKLRSSAPVTVKGFFQKKLKNKCEPDRYRETLTLDLKGVLTVDSIL